MQTIPEVKNVHRKGKQVRWHMDGPSGTNPTAAMANYGKKVLVACMAVGRTKKGFKGIQPLVSTNDFKDNAYQFLSVDIGKSRLSLSWHASAQRTFAAP